MTTLSGITALRMDDVGAASKRNNVHGNTRLSVGRWKMPFPANWLFFKYIPPFKEAGPYRELTEKDWRAVLALLERYGARLTVGITASWVVEERTLVPFPRMFPRAAAVIREGVESGLVEVANHGLTHCVLAGGAFRPRLFASNRRFHREFWDWVPIEVHDEHLRRSQEILTGFFGGVVTFIPPGNVCTEETLALARRYGLRYFCYKTQTRCEADGAVFIGDADIVPFHDRDIVLHGLSWLEKQLIALAASGVEIRFVQECAARLVGASSRVANS